MKRMLMLATTAAMIEQFNKNNILILKNMGYEIHVAGNWEQGNPISNDRLKNFKIWLEENNGIWHQIPAVRNPIDLKSNSRAYKIVVRLIRKYNYIFIHCHTPIGSVIGRIAAHFTCTKIIYTAHGFHFYDGAPLKNWLLYYPVEKFLSRWTDVLITINKEDYQRAIKRFRAKKTVYIPGVGIDIKKISGLDSSREEIRTELGIKDNDFVILSVGELIPRKNHRVVIEAISKLKNDTVFENIQYIICGSGPEEDRLKALAKDLEISEFIHILGYRNDISEICNASDLFVFMSFQEGLPVALMEAMSSGLPIICTKIRGNIDLIEDGISGIFAENNSVKLAAKINELIANPEKCNMLGMNAKNGIKLFDLKIIGNEVKNMYMEAIEEFSVRGGKKLPAIIRQQLLRQELNIPHDAFVLLSVGEINRNKNHKVIIEALRLMKEEKTLFPKLYYVICGKGIMQDKLDKLINLYGLKNKVIFTGYREDILNFYEMADLFVFPSYREGLSVALMEAMVCGLPVVCRDIRGNKDLIENNIGGYLVHGNSVDGYASVIKKMIDDGTLKAAAMGRFNQIKIKDFSEYRVNQFMNCLYKEI